MVVKKELKPEVAPVELYTYYSLAVLFDILKKKNIMETKDMRFLIKRVNEKLKKAGYK